MAGNYPDVPAPRIAYDRDGSIVFRQNQSGTIDVLSLGNAQAMNDESSSGVNSTSQSGTWTVYYGVIFPYLMDLSGFAISARSGGDYRMDNFATSPDTTNGEDGTWTTQVASLTDIGASPLPGYRSAITSASLTNVKAVRFRARKILGAASGSQTCYSFHLYGALVAGQNEDRLRLWHPTLDEPLDENNSADGAYLDWGDVPRGTTQDRTFRLRNNSTTLTANSITIATQVLTDASPSLPPQFTYSNGGAFSTTLNIGTLVPGATSSVITMRRATPSNAALSLWAGRVTIDPASWS